MGDDGEGDGWPVVGADEHEHRWPLITRRKEGYLPSASDILKAYAWRMGVEANADVSVPPGTTEDVRRILVSLLFPAPSRAQTVGEVRSLLAAAVVRDGLWTDFKVGAPFTEYVDAMGRVYTDEEAEEWGMAFAEALRSLGELELYGVAMDLTETLLMPG